MAKSKVINSHTILCAFLTILLFCFILLVQEQTSALQPTLTLAQNPTATPTLSIEERIALIEKWQAEAEKRLEQPQKDVWDKIESVSGLVSGGVIALVGIFFTYFYQERQRQSAVQQKQQEIAILQVQTVQSFMPQLQSKDERAIEAALLAIAALGNTDLATKLAELFRSKGAVMALSKIGRSKPGDSQKVLLPLASLLRDESSDVRKAAAKALGQLADPTATQYLIEALRDIDDGVRQAAAEALGRLGYSQENQAG